MLRNLFVRRIVYILAMLLAIVTTVFVGSVVASRSKNSAASSVAIIVVSLFNGFIPIISQFYPSISKVTRFWYTQVISDIISDLYDSFYLNLPNRFLILIIHILSFLALFMFVFKQNKLLNEK